MPNDNCLYCRNCSKYNIEQSPNIVGEKTIAQYYAHAFYGLQTLFSGGRASRPYASDTKKYRFLGMALHLFLEIVL
jgi:hypothetical protein